MRNDKQKAIDLRKKGETYNEISRTLGISKGTLSFWFKKENWAEEVTNKNKDSEKIIRTERISKLNQARAEKLLGYYQKAKEQAAEEFTTFKNNPVFIAGLMLYSGEGDKNSLTNLVRISNSDFLVHKIFLRFLEEICLINKDKIRFWALLYPDLNKTFCEEMWAKELGLSKENFYKTQVIEGKSKKRKLLYGTGNIIIGNKFLKVKVLEWIRLLSEELCLKK